MVNVKPISSAVEREVLKRNDLFWAVMKSIKWKKISVPVKKNPFPEDEKW